MKVFLSLFLTIWEKIKNGGYEHQRNDYSCLYQSTGRRFTQTAKAYPIEPINMGLSSEMNFGAQIILKHIQNHPGHIYNIPCKTAQTFPTQSLNHLCHVLKKISKFLREGRWILASLKKLKQTSSQECFGSPELLSNADGLPASDLRNTCKWMWPVNPEPANPFLCHRENEITGPHPHPLTLSVWIVHYAIAKSSWF